MPEVDYNDIPVEWWDGDCDKSMLIGVYKHGKPVFEVLYNLAKNNLKVIHYSESG